MTSSQNPLKLAEILDHTLSFIDLRRDLLTSALVSRSWVHPSQSRIFASIYLIGEHGRRLIAVLGTSRHLVDHVLTIRIFNFTTMDPESRRTLAELPFSRVTDVSIGTDNNDPSLSAAAELDIRALLRIPSLTDVTAHLKFESWDSFLRVWDGCSIAIKHLSLRHSKFDDWEAHKPSDGSTAPQTRNPIRLKSFDGISCSDIIAAWLLDPRCPFEVSGLEAFRGSLPVSKLLLPVITESLDTIKILSFSKETMQNVPFTWFPNVTEFDIHGPQFAFDFVRDIPDDVRSQILAVRLQLW
ncbi:hypothetical protein FB45DRAFT_932155, partial [Roridomyces roridus]